MALDRQRIDKWLWHARIARTRSAAATLAGSGRVRLNGMRVDAASRIVKPGDVLTIALDSRIRVVRVLAFAVRRGGAEAARVLYEEQPFTAANANVACGQQSLVVEGRVHASRPGRGRRKADRFSGGGRRE